MPTASRLRTTGERQRAGSTRWGRSLLAHAWQKGRSLDIVTHALALAAQQVLCTAPLLVAVSALLQRFHLGSVVSLLTDLLGLDGRSARAMVMLFRTRFSPTTGSLVIGLALSLAFATGSAATTQRMLEAVWGVARAPWHSQWRQAIWVLALTPGVAAAMYAAHVGRTGPMTDPTSNVLVSLLLGLCAFGFAWWSQHLLLRGVIGWRHLLPGSALIGGGIVVASVVSMQVVPDELVDEAASYGPIGVAMVLSVWVMSLTAVMVVGALAGAVIDERRYGVVPG